MEELDVSHRSGRVALLSAYVGPPGTTSKGSIRAGVGVRPEKDLSSALS